MDVYEVWISMKAFGLLHQYKPAFCLDPYIVYVTGFMKRVLYTQLYIFINTFLQFITSQKWI